MYRRCMTPSITAFSRFLVAWFLLPLAAMAQPRFSLDATPTALPKSALPSRVALDLDVDPARDEFTGHARIEITVRAAMPAIVLHARDLTATAARLHGRGRPRTLEVEPDAGAGTWRLVPADRRMVAPGRYSVDIRYRGRVQLSGQGLFRVPYRVGDDTRTMLVTQLQAIDGRRLLPMFDEPVFRVSFRLSVRAPAAYDVVSNMPKLSAKADGGFRHHRFAPTPPMPSYLLALAVGQFDALEDRVAGVPVRILTPPGKREQARFALTAVQQVLPFFEAYFGRPYALPKMDLLAVPGVMMGAMENWGLVTYIEDALLFDPAHGRTEQQRGVFAVVAHEVAHQWFGNLVSPASWTEIWLNEAFATWLERKASHRFHPEWNVKLESRRWLERAIDRDSTPATRPIRSGPVRESSVFEVFDNITYGKGGAVLSMLEQWVGPEAFQRGLAAYMAERAMKPSTAGDLWHHIGAAARRPVAEVASSWTDQPGIPLIEVDLACEDGGSTVTLAQRRFALGEPIAGGPWRVPVRLQQGDRAEVVLLDDARARLRWPGCSAEPLLANAGGEGYYRVSYSPALQRRLLEGFGRLAPGDRLAVVSDSYALANAGSIPMAEHLKLLRRVGEIDDASRSVMFALASQQWRQLDVALDGTRAQPAVRAAGHDILAAELARLGWDARPGEDDETLRLRATVIETLGRLRHAPTLDAARLRFADALARSPRVHPSVRAAVLAAVGCEPDAEQFDALLTAYRNAGSQEDRWILHEALANGDDPQRARRLLDEALSGRLPPDISAAIPAAIAERPALGPLAYGFVLEHWSELSRLAGDGVFGGQHWLLPGTAQASSDPAVAARLQQDQQRLTGDAGSSAAQIVAQGIEVRHRLREREAMRLAP